jgi:ubiquitin-conjugating enzyme E2 J2
MASSAAIRRLRKEYQLIQASPEYGIVAAPLERDILEWHFVLHGSGDTPYQGGLYHGKLIFPNNFPMKPPSILMITESGRFVTRQKICMSMSDFHPELWNPVWSVRTILVGMLSFMNSDEQTTGGIVASDIERRDAARASLEAIRNDELVKELFADICDLAEQRLRLYTDNWPPPVLPPPIKLYIEETVDQPNPVESAIIADMSSICVTDIPSEGIVDSKTSIESAEKDMTVEEEVRKPSKSSKKNAARRAKAKTQKQTISALNIVDDDARDEKDDMNNGNDDSLDSAAISCARESSIDLKISK